MKFRCVDEFEQLSFDDSPIVSFQMSTDEVTFTFGGATIKAGNSQNGRFQDMYCGEITLTLLQAQMKRLVKEGMKYYDADGNLQREIPDEDVPEPAVESVVSRFEKGTVFTVVLGELMAEKVPSLALMCHRKKTKRKLTHTGSVLCLKNRKRLGSVTAVRQKGQIPR